MEFEWDEAKAETNLRKHDVPFREAATVFDDPLAMTFADPDHSEEEERLLTFGYSNKERLLAVAHTARDKRVRLITARPVTRAERETYEEG
jgi:uncharacterized protein